MKKKTKQKVRLSQHCWHWAANKPQQVNQQKWSSGCHRLALIFLFFPFFLRSRLSGSDRLQQQLQHQILSSHWQNEPASSHIYRIHTCNRGKKTQLSLRGRQRCAYAKMQLKERGGLRCVSCKSIHTDMPSSVSDKLATAFFFFFLQPLKLISGKKYWRSHLDRHAGCDVRCTGLAQALGIGMRTGMTLERRSLRCRYIFSQVSCFFVFFTVWHVVCPQGVRGKPWDSRCARLQHLVSARVKRGHGSLCLQTSVQWTG